MGRVKFRCHDNWAQNSLAILDSRDDLIRKVELDGRDINIREEGAYHITLKLKDLTYKFEKIAE